MSKCNTWRTSNISNLLDVHLVRKRGLVLLLLLNRFIIPICRKVCMFFQLVNLFGNLSIILSKMYVKYARLYANPLSGPVPDPHPYITRISFSKLYQYLQNNHKLMVWNRNFRNGIYKTYFLLVNPFPTTCPTIKYKFTFAIP